MTLLHSSEHNLFGYQLRGEQEQKFFCNMPPKNDPEVLALRKELEEIYNKLKVILLRYFIHISHKDS